MAKIKETEDFDDLNFDDLGDFDDFGSFDDAEPTAGKRSVFGRLLGGFKDGVKASFTDPKTHRDVIVKSLPKGYSRIYDAGEFATESMGDLIGEARKGYGANKNQMKQAMRDILPSLGENVNGSKIGKNIKGWADDIRQPDLNEDVDPEAAYLATEMGDTFGTPNESGVGGGSSEDKAKKGRKITEDAQRKMMEHASRTSQIMTDRMSMQMSQDMVRHLGGMHAELQRMNAYQDQITNVYQRKSLEIKYRSYFVARKALDINMQSLDLNKSAYEKIIVNTSLPEAVKIQSSEHAQMILREKFLGSVITPASAKLGQVGSRILQKSKMKIQEFFKDLGANLGNLNDATSILFGQDSEMDFTQDIVGDTAGRAAGGKVANTLAAKLSRKLSGNKKLSRLGEAGASMFDNGGRIFQSMLQNDSGVKLFEWLKGTGFLDEFAYRRDETLRKDATSMLDDQALWDQKSRKALTEVIPGLLERSNFTTASILAYMRGEEAPSMERYNYASGLFETDKVIRERIDKEVFGEAANKDTAQALRNFVGEFEQKRKLSPEAKKALMKVGMDEALSGKQMNLEAYQRQDQKFSTDENIQKEIHAAFMESHYFDHKEGIDENTEGGFMGDLNRTYRRGEAINSRSKLMNSLQSIASNQGSLDMSKMLQNLNVAGGNTIIDMGIGRQDGNKIVMNREKIDNTIIQQALGMDIGYLTSNVFDLEESENSLGHSVNSHVRKLILDLDKRYQADIPAEEVTLLRAVFGGISDSVFAGSNAPLLNRTDLDLAQKRELLKAISDLLVQWMGSADYTARLGDKGQDYFRVRLDLIKASLTAARITAPLRDFMTPPLKIDPSAWSKSKKKVLDGLKDAGVDDEILKKLENSIKDIKDSSGKTVDMKLAELTGTKTYSEAARFINRMSDKGMAWLIKSLKDPNTPPDPVTDPNSMFTRMSQTTEHLANHSAIGRWMYKQFLNMDSTVNNSYENIENNQNKQSELDKLAGNANGEESWYEGSKRNRSKEFNPLAQSGFGVNAPGSHASRFGGVDSNTVYSEIAKEAADQRTSIIETSVNTAVDFLQRIADRLANGGNKPPSVSWNNQGPLFNPMNAGPNSGSTITGINHDIEIHHQGGIVGQGKKWGGGSLFGSAPRFHQGGMVKGNLHLERSTTELGIIIATLPNGQQVRILSKTLRRLGNRASKKHIADAMRLAEKEVRGKYASLFKGESGGNEPTTGQAVLKANEVPAVLERGEEVLTAKDPRHRNNIAEADLSEVNGNDHHEYLKGILENTTIANQFLQEIVAKEFKGGSDALGKMSDKINKGWTSAKTRGGKIVGSIRKRVTGIFGGGGSLFGKAKNFVKKLWNSDEPGMFSKARDYAKEKIVGAGNYLGDKLPIAGKWMQSKAEDIGTSAKEIGKKLRGKIPTLEEIKKAGGVVIDNTLVPAKDFISKKYTASKEWWSENHPKFKLDFSGFWTSFKEKFSDWKPVEWAKEKGASARSMLGTGLNTLKEGVGNVFSAPKKVLKWGAGKVRRGLGMLRGFMSGGAWAAMKYRDVDGITDEVSGLRQVYLGLVDLQSIVMDRLPKKKTAWNDKDGDGKRDASARFMGRAEKEVKVDKEGNPLPGEEKKTNSLFGNMFGGSMMGLAIKALIGGLVGETMSKLFGFDLGLVGNTVAGMAAVGGGLWAAKKGAGFLAGKAAQGVGGLWNRARGRGGAGAGTGRGAGGAAGGVADILGGGGGNGCCCCDNDDGFDMDTNERRRKKRGGRRGRRGRAGRSRGGPNNRNTRANRGGANPRGGNPRSGAGRGAAGAAGRAGAAGAAGRAGAAGAAGRGLGGLGGVAGRVAMPLALAAGGYGLYQTLNDDEATTEEKVSGASEVVGGMGGGIAGAMAGAAIGSVVPVIGTVIGGIIGGIAGQWLGSKAGSAVGEGINGATASGKDAEKQAVVDAAKEKANTGEKLTPEEKKAVEEETKKDPNFLVTLIKYSPIGLAWFAANGLMSLISGALGLAWDGVKWVASGIGKVVGAAAGLIGSAIGGAAGMIWNGAKFVVGTAAKLVGGAAGLLWDGVKWVAGTAGKIIGGAAGMAWNGVKWVAKTALNVVTAPFKAAAWIGKKVWGGVKAAGSAVATVVTAPFKAVAWAGEKIGNGIKAAGSAIMGIPGAGMAMSLLPGAGLLMMGSKLFGGLKGSDNPVTRFRFAQYGFDYDKEKTTSPIMSLEEDLLKGVSVTGKARINPKRPFEEYLKMFGIDASQEKEKNDWLTWFHYRFTPVFLSHCSEWNRVLRNTRIHDGDEKLGDEAAAEYLKNVHYKNAKTAPYVRMEDPFAKGSTLYDTAKVGKEYDIAVEDVKSFPKRALGDMEKKALGKDADTKNEAAKTAEEKKAEKGDPIKEDSTGLWDSVKSIGGNIMGAAGAALSAINPMNFFTKKDENQMSGWDRLSNSVVTAGQEAVGSVGSFLGGGKSYASHELTLAKACMDSGITHPKEVAMFIAQCAHETGGFKWLKELGNDSYFNKYNGRKDLGNGPSDGARFKGRGYIHLTGRSNYTRFAKASGIDVVNKPDLVSDDKGVAAKAAIFWWLNSKRARAAGQAGDVVGASKAVNGGTNGLQDRISKWNYYSKAIGNDLNGWIAKLSGGAGGAPDKGAATGTAANTVGVLASAANGIAATGVGMKAQAAGMMASAGAAVGAAVGKGKDVLNDIAGNVGIGTGGSPTAATPGGKGATPWMSLAEKQLGVNEKDHPGLIRDYHKLGGNLNAGGSTPWCASFIGWVLEKCGLKGSGSAAAISYAKYGTTLDKSKPIPYGAIMVIKFGSGNHVAFCASDQGSKVTMLGGNQSSKKNGNQRNGGEVTKSTIPKSNVYAVVYPSGYTAGAAKTVADNVSDSAAGVGTPNESGVGGSGAVTDSTPATPTPWSFKGTATSTAKYGGMAQLDKVQGKVAPEDAPAPVSATTKNALAASETKSADAARIKIAENGESPLQKIAGYGFRDTTTNGSALAGKTVTAAQVAVATQTKTDLNAVKQAEQVASVSKAGQREADKVAEANLRAKSDQRAKVGQDVQTEMLNVMREQLAETRRGNATLREISVGIKQLVSKGGSNLRGEDKQPAKPPRQPSKPEDVPISMRV